MSEVNAALALAQSQRIDSLVGKLQRVKSSITEQIADIQPIQLQRIADPAGDVSYSLVFYLSAPADAERFSEQRRDEGIPSLTMNNKGIPDRHIYTNWDYVLNKQGIADRDNPWTNPWYGGSVQYSRDMCPNTLNLLSRAVALNLHQHMTEADCAAVANAIRKAARNLT